MKERLPSIKFIPIDKTGSLAQLKNDGIKVVINTYLINMRTLNLLYLCLLVHHPLNTLIVMYM